MCQMRSHVNIAADPASSLQEELSALRNNPRWEQQKNVELEGICRDLNQDNDRYLNMALQLESAIENLLVSLSLPTDTLYRTGVTDYHELLCLIDNETPRLKNLMSGLDMLASLAVGLNASIEMHKDQISTLQEHNRRLESDKAGVECGGTVLRPCSQSSSAPSSNESSETTTCAGDFDEFTANGINQTSVMAVDERLPLALSLHSNQPLSSTPKNIPSPKTQQKLDVKDKTLHPESGASKFTGQLKCPPRELCSQRHSAFEIFNNLSGSNTLLRRDINCAISVNGHRLAGNPFCYHPGWRIHFCLNLQMESPYISLKFRLCGGKSGKTRKNQEVKGFGMMWELFRDDSVVLKEVKPYKPASLRNLPLSLTELCTDKHVRGTLWLVSLIGVFDSPPAHSHRILENLDEDIKTNLKALFRPQNANHLDIWLINPKDGDRRRQRLDMDGLMALQSLH